MKIILSDPRGFCAGVSRAITVVEEVIDIYKKPIYVRHEVVHNKFVVDSLKRKGAIFVKELSEVPDKEVVIFSAHGVSENIQQEAIKRDLMVFNATCPLVTKVHVQVKRASDKNQDCILIGHKGHPEVLGTLGHYSSKIGRIYLVENFIDITNMKVVQPDNIIYVTQTTLSVEDTHKMISALKLKLPNIIAPKREDICYATTNRQNAVKKLANQVDLILVVGSKNSSNSNRLKELSIDCGTNAYLIDDYSEIDLNWFKNVNILGITAGASAPEILVTGILDYIKNQYPYSIVEKLNGIKEDINFPLPKLLINIKKEL